MPIAMWVMGNLAKNTFILISFLGGFTPCKAEPLLQGVKLQEKKAQKD